MDQISDINVINDLKVAANEPNGKYLLVNQFANTSESYSNSNLPTNVSFTLAQDWISKDITISYDGVSIKKDRVINGTFDSDYHGWTYKTNNPTEFIGKNESEFVMITLTSGDKSEGEYGYFERNISIQEKLSSNKLALLSFDYYLDKDNPINIFRYHFL